MVNYCGLNEKRTKNYGVPLNQRKIRRRTKPKYKSKLEVRSSKFLPDADKVYETLELTYTVDHKYKPDFPYGKKLIEVKGYFDAADRAKHLYIKQQHPEYQVLFLFANSKNKLNRASKTTYASWCEKYGFAYTDIASVEKDPSIITKWLEGE